MYTFLYSRSYPENRTKHWAFILIFLSMWGEALFTSCALCSWQIDQISILSTYTQLCIFIIIIIVDDFDTPWCLFAVHCFNEVLLMRFVTKKCDLKVSLVFAHYFSVRRNWLDFEIGGFLICLLWFVCYIVIWSGFGWKYVLMIRFTILWIRKGPWLYWILCLGDFRALTALIRAKRSSTLVKFHRILYYRLEAT
jgi:hypothetical protein